MLLDPLELAALPLDLELLLLTLASPEPKSVVASGLPFPWLPPPSGVPALLPAEEPQFA
jgi:hypothetical protein